MSLIKCTILLLISVFLSGTSARSLVFWNPFDVSTHNHASSGASAYSNAASTSFNLGPFLSLSGSFSNSLSSAYSHVRNKRDVSSIASAKSNAFSNGQSASQSSAISSASANTAGNILPNPTELTESQNSYANTFSNAQTIDHPTLDSSTNFATDILPKVQSTVPNFNQGAKFSKAYAAAETGSQSFANENNQSYNGESLANTQNSNSQNGILDSDQNLGYHYYQNYHSSKSSEAFSSAQSKAQNIGLNIPTQTFETFPNTPNFGNQNYNLDGTISSIGNGFANNQNNNGQNFNLGSFTDSFSHAKSNAQTPYYQNYNLGTGNTAYTNTFSKTQGISPSNFGLNGPSQSFANQQAITQPISQQNCGVGSNTYATAEALASARNGPTLNYNLNRYPSAAPAYSYQNHGLSNFGSASNAQANAATNTGPFFGFSGATNTFANAQANALSNRGLNYGLGGYSGAFAKAEASALPNTQLVPPLEPFLSPFGASAAHDNTVHFTDGSRNYAGGSFGQASALSSSGINGANSAAFANAGASARGQTFRRPIF